MRYNLENFNDKKSQDVIECYCDSCDGIFYKKKALVSYILKNDENREIFCKTSCQYKSGNTRILKCKECENEYTTNRKSSMFCSLSCSAKYNNSHRDWNLEWTDERRLKAANAVLSSKAGFMKDPVFYASKGVKPLIKKQCNHCGCSFEVKPCKRNRLYCSKKCSGHHNYHPNSTKATRCMYNGFALDSGAELAFAKLLDTHHISWIKNQIKFFNFTDLNGKIRKYYPDFYLPDYDWWVEIKGKRYSRPDDHLRLKSVSNIELMFSDSIGLPLPCKHYKIGTSDR